MKLFYRSVFCCWCSFLFVFSPAFAQTIYVNQIGFDSKGAKVAVAGVPERLDARLPFDLIDVATHKSVFRARLGQAQQVPSWDAKSYFYEADFSAFAQKGKYQVSLNYKGKTVVSAPFEIADQALARLTIPAIIHYYFKQRANTPQELAVDKAILLQGSNQAVDLRGGWCDASGDVSKYFSHLAYTNFMMPQQIPMVTWSMAGTVEKIPNLLQQLGVQDSLRNEALWGADYLVRSLSKEGYFYMTVFSFFNKENPSARRVVGLLADSKVTDQYQSAFREGGGMAIAALARISRWKKDGEFTSSQYLEAAKRAFAHLLVNNTVYDDDGKENIIDDYCALTAATELWISTNDNLYQTEARKRAQNLQKRLSAKGYFIADDKNRPFWHAADAGMPVIALARYLDKENDADLRKSALNVIKKFLDYQLAVTNNVANPFGYARQSFLFKGQYREGFFIPHENESGWWWQGENARLGSLAAAAIVGGRLVNPQGQQAVKPELAKFASQQLSWVLGCNPYEICLMYGFGKQNVPYMASMFGHGSERGGISNGITGAKGQADGSGIDFKMHDDGNEWRWTEQWIPHAAWFLQAVTAMAQ